MKVLKHLLMLSGQLSLKKLLWLLAEEWMKLLLGLSKLVGELLKLLSLGELMKLRVLWTIGRANIMFLMYGYPRAACIVTLTTEREAQINHTIIMDAVAHKGAIIVEQLPIKVHSLAAW